MEIFYTSEDKEKILSTMQYIADDLITLWEKSKTDYLTINSSFLNIGSDSNITINKKGVTLTTYKRVYDAIYSDYDCKVHHRYVFSRKNKKEIKLGTKDENVLVPIISNYERIRALFLAKTYKHAEVKGQKTDVVDEWYNRFKKETEIEFDLPETNNQHELVVTSENGKTIGTIDFGDKIIKIITKGDIRFVDKREEQAKVKTK